MKQTVNFNQFVDAFQIRNDNFSYAGLRALFDYMEELETDTGEAIELDPIAFCCEYSEYEDLAEIQDQYDDVDTLDDLQDRTQVIVFDTGIIIQDF